MARIRDFAIYDFRDENNVCLYVGKSIEWLKRDHKLAEWYHRATHHNLIGRFRTKEEMALAEAEAIRRLKPLFNKMLNKVTNRKELHELFLFSLYLMGRLPHDETDAISTLAIGRGFVIVAAVLKGIRPGDLFKVDSIGSEEISLVKSAGWLRQKAIEFGHMVQSQRGDWRLSHEGVALVENSGWPDFLLEIGRSQANVMHDRRLQQISLNGMNGLFDDNVLKHALHKRPVIRRRPISESKTHE